jgi:HSP20 family protein
MATAEWRGQWAATVFAKLANCLPARSASAGRVCHFDSLGQAHPMLSLWNVIGRTITGIRRTRGDLFPNQSLRGETAMMNSSLMPTFNRVLAFDRDFDRMVTGLSSKRFFVPALDVVERADAYLVSAELPGVDPKSVEIQFENNTLTLRGTKQPWLQRQENEELRVYTAERVNGEFERAVRLPEYVEGDKIEASYEHGVLTITVPKAEAARARKIEIKAVSR